MSGESFVGFGEDVQIFLAELRRNNTREWFEANRERYVTEARDPAMAFISSLGERLLSAYPDLRFGTKLNGSGSLMRPHRDTRFSNDKRPFKENLGIVFWLGDGKKLERPIFYLHIDPERIFFYGGQHGFSKEVLGRYRVAVDNDGSGSELEQILRDLSGSGLVQYEDPAYKRIPSGFDRDHPRGDLLRMSAVGVGRDLSFREIVSAGLVERCAADAVTMKPLMEWLLVIND